MLSNGQLETAHAANGCLGDHHERATRLSVQPKDAGDADSPAGPVWVRGSLITAGSDMSRHGMPLVPNGDNRLLHRVACGGRGRAYGPLGASGFRQIAAKGAAHADRIEPTRSVTTPTRRVNLNKRHESPTESGSLRRLGDRRPVTGQPDQGHREALLNAMRNGSVGAYGHFNLHGEFGFSPERMIDSIGLWFPKDPSPKGHEIWDVRIRISPCPL